MALALLAEGSYFAANIRSIVKLRPEFDHINVDGEQLATVTSMIRLRFTQLSRHIHGVSLVAFMFCGQVFVVPKWV